MQSQSQQSHQSPVRVQENPSGGLLRIVAPDGVVSTVPTGEFDRASYPGYRVLERVK